MAKIRCSKIVCDIPKSVEIKGKFVSKRLKYFQSFFILSIAILKKLYYNKFKWCKVV